jgi:hypothetical protein
MSKSHTGNGSCEDEGKVCRRSVGAKWNAGSGLADHANLEANDLLRAAKAALGTDRRAWRTSPVARSIQSTQGRGNIATHK